VGVYEIVYYVQLDSYTSVKSLESPSFTISVVNVCLTASLSFGTNPFQSITYILGSATTQKSFHDTIATASTDPFNCGPKTVSFFVDWGQGKVAQSDIFVVSSSP